jgi:hypothetical protein
MSQPIETLIEQELGLKLPSPCVGYLSAFPFAPDSFVVWAGLVYMPQHIVKTTKWHRANGFFNQAWPDNFLIIGGDGLGNEFFVDVAIANSPVFLADHEVCCSATQLVFNQSDSDLETWIEAMRQTEETTPEWIKAQALED